MTRRLKTFLAILLFCCAFYSQAMALSGEKMLYTLDKENHFPREFSAVLRAIHYYNPYYSVAEIADLITQAYFTIKLNGTDISLYEVADGIRRFSSDELGIDFKEMVHAFINSQLQ